MSNKIMRNSSNKRRLNPTYKSWAKGPLPRKVTLTDLCPEQKGKIGELMLLIEKHRQENDQICNENSQLKILNQELKEKVLRLEFDNSNYQQRVKELCKLLDDLQEHLSIKEQQFNQFQSSLNKIFVHRQIQVNFASQHQYSPINQHEESTLSRESKHVEHIKVQTEYNSPVKSQSKKGNNSKAFKRIMTGLASINKAVDQKMASNSHQWIQSSLNSVEEEEDFSNLAKFWIKIKKENQTQKESFIHHPYKSVDSADDQDYQQLMAHYQKLRVDRIQHQNKDSIDQNQLNAMLKKGDFKATQILRTTTREHQKNQDRGKEFSGLR